MKVSWNWLKEYLDLSAIGGPEGLAKLLTSRGIEVEEIHRQDKGFEKVVSVKILERNPHPQADRLSLCKVTLGSGDPLEIVCGAQNMKAGDIVALAQIGADLPNGLKITQSKIRGVVSNGMLCSEEELKLKDKSEGILILPPTTGLGIGLAQILGRDDTVFVLKLTANRGDCLGHYGLAREIGAAIGQKPKRMNTVSMPGGKSPISILLEANDEAPQFYGCTIEGVKIGPSPDWVVKRLEAVGSRSINNVVDASNLAMLETGHPMHSYDAELIEGSVIKVRLSERTENLPLLDGTSVQLNGSELVISDGKKAVGLAGVMGGGNSEVRPSTTRLFLECAEFSPTLIRRASQKHQKKTEASHRFERGIDPEGLDYALSRLAALTLELAGGKVTSSVIARKPSRENLISARKKIKMPKTFVSEFLGMKLESEKIVSILENLDCQVSQQSDSFEVTVPSYRRDIVIKEDLSEEIARTVGYDKIPATTPILSNHPTSLTAVEAIAASRQNLIERTKDVAIQLGLNETLNFAFTSQSWLSQFGMKSAARILNPLSEEIEYLVPSLIPGLVKNAMDNWRHHFGSENLALRLFEIRPTFEANGEIQSAGELETGVTEKWKLSVLLSGPRLGSSLKADQNFVDFYDLKAVCEGLLEGLGAKGCRFQAFGEKTNAQAQQLFHPGQAAEVWMGNQIGGHLGLIHPKLSRKLELKDPSYLIELDCEALYKLSLAAHEVRPLKAWSEFPPMERDFALLVQSGVNADKILSVALKSGRPLAKVAKIFDIYRGSQVAQGMTSIGVRVIFSEEGRSLQEQETEAASAQILAAWKKELGIELRT